MIAQIGCSWLDLRREGAWTYIKDAHCIEELEVAKWAGVACLSRKVGSKDSSEETRQTHDSFLKRYDDTKNRSRLY